MRRGGVGIIIAFLVLFALIIFLIPTILYHIQTFLKGAHGGVISETVQSTITSVRKIYTNFQTAWDMALNPWKYTYTATPAKPAEEVLREQYGFNIENLVAVSPVPYFVCKDLNCSDITIPEIVVLAPVYYHFLTPTKVVFGCNVTTTYDDNNCFKKIIKLYPTQLQLAKRGDVNARCTVRLVFNKTNIRCHDCDLLTKLNSKTCIKQPVIFKDEGFRVDIRLNATFTTTAKTMYKTLIIPERTFIEALVKKKNVYSMLRLSQSDYDIGTYYGLLNYPKIDIGRLVYNEYQYPIILFGNNWSYDVYIFELRDLNNIKSINSFKIKFLVPSGIVLRYLNIAGNTGGCTDTLTYSINLQASGKIIKPFSIVCSKNVCNIHLDPSYIKNLINYNKDLKVDIPVCLKSTSSFNGDYADLVVIANITYVYNSVVKTPYSLTYEQFKLS